MGWELEKKKKSVTDLFWFFKGEKGGAACSKPYPSSPKGKKKTSLVCLFGWVLEASVVGGVQILKKNKDGIKSEKRKWVKDGSHPQPQKMNNGRASSFSGGCPHKEGILQGPKHPPGGVFVGFSEIT